MDDESDKGSQVDSELTDESDAEDEDAEERRGEIELADLPPLMDNDDDNEGNNDGKTKQKCHLLRRCYPPTTVPIMEAEWKRGRGEGRRGEGGEGNTSKSPSKSVSSSPSR